MTANPRILYIIGQLSRGGAEQQFYYLLKYLRPEAIVISLREGGFWANPIRELGYEVIELKRHGRADISRFVAIVRAIRAYKPDIIHLFMDNVYGLYGRLAAILTGHRRVIVSVRTHPTFDPPWYIALQKLILNRFVQCITTNTQAALTYVVQEMGFPQARVRFTPNGVEIKRIQAESRQGDYPFPVEWREKTVIGMVGSFTPVKDPMLFVRMVRRVSQVFPDVRFVMVGDGELRPEVERLRSEFGLDEKLLLAGERQDVPRWLGAMNVFILTSRIEGLSNAMMEAMAVGLPCVVTDAGGCRELVKDSETGYVVAVGDEEGLAERVQRMITDAELRPRLGARAREMIEQFDVKVTAEQYRELYAVLACSGCQL